MGWTELDPCCSTPSTGPGCAPGCCLLLQGGEGRNVVGSHLCHGLWEHGELLVSRHGYGRKGDMWCVAGVRDTEPVHLVLELVALGLVTLHGMVLRCTAVSALGRLWVKGATAALDLWGTYG